ncbi:hypothetical protein [Hahella ganghwensis]|uniref:hypothetical protein n=1 Tax=Hahella ganghwensis TaxID=286420 RepID=UPI00037D3F61|nr:hypothetical protein [Hahella ganghwensis]
MRAALLSIAMLVLCSCAAVDSALSTRGIITESTSQFDNKRVVNLSPAIIEHGGFMAGLYWDSDKQDRAFFTFAVDGTYSFVPDEPLMLKIDGRLVELPPVNVDSYGEIEYDKVMYKNVSFKDYWISKADIKAFVDAQETTYRVMFRKGFHDGAVDYGWKGYKSYAVTGFDDFYQRVWGG